MARPHLLQPARDLVKKNHVSFPHESAEYRQARDALLVEEIELRRHIERVALQRRGLPPGGALSDTFGFQGERGPVSFAELFGDKDTLGIYSFMYGPERTAPCPMCTSLLSAWDGEAADIEQRMALAVVARSPIDRLVEFKEHRGWRHLKLYSDGKGDYSRAYHGLTPDGDEVPAFNVFSRRDGTIRHFWSGEMGQETADPGQDPRGAPDLMPIWTILDCTPEGRDPKWYPKLQYPAP